MTLAEGARVHNAFRFTPRGEGSLLTFVVLHAAGSSQQSFDADVAQVRGDLPALEQRLEQRKT